MPDKYTEIKPGVFCNLHFNAESEEVKSTVIAATSLSKIQIEGLKEMNLRRLRRCKRIYRTEVPEAKENLITIMKATKKGSEPSDYKILIVHEDEKVVQYRIMNKKEESELQSAAVEIDVSGRRFFFSESFGIIKL